MCKFNTPGLPQTFVTGITAGIGDLTQNPPTPYSGPLGWSYTSIWGTSSGVTADCTTCPTANGAVVDTTRLVCECDIFHTGAGCTSCRPEWDATTCDGSTCAANYTTDLMSPTSVLGWLLNSFSFGTPPVDMTDPLQVATLPQTSCSECAPGYCRASPASADGRFCGLCADCVGNGGTLNATMRMCKCPPGFRGVACDECMPQFAGAGCTACAPGYANPPACNVCDPTAGFCGVTFADSVSARLLQPNSGNTPLPDIIQDILYSTVGDPLLSYCAPCDACDPAYGDTTTNPGNCTCITGPNGQPGQGPSCSMVAAGGCFPAAARVFTERAGGWERLDAVPTGARVMAADPDTGTLSFSPLVAWWHHDGAARATFVRLTAASGAALTLSGQHYVHASPAGCAAAAGWASAELMLARDVRPAWGLWVVAGGLLQCSPVVSVSFVLEAGLFSPVSLSGNVIVDGVSASSLVSYGPWPLPVLKAHHALLTTLHSRLGALGLALLDALHAPFYALRGIPQPTNARVARELAAAASSRNQLGDASPLPLSAALATPAVASVGVCSL
jgi:hypothetical protein